MKKVDVAKHIFARNPKLNEIHVTSDGQGFHTEQQAEAHAVRLKDPKIEPFKRSDVLPAKAVKQLKADKTEETEQDLQKVQDAAERVEYAKSIGVDTEGIETSEELEAAITEAEAAAAKAKDLDVNTESDAVDTSFLDKNVDECEAEIEKVANLKHLDAIEKAEEAKEEPRKGVQKAIAKQRKKLQE